jgi:hypothetical protein
MLMQNIQTVCAYCRIERLLYNGRIDPELAMAKVFHWKEGKR